MRRIDAVRRAAGVAMGLAPTPAHVPMVSPKLGILASPRPTSTLSGDKVDLGDHDLVARVESMGRIHRAIQGTGALAVAVAAKIPGTVAAALAGPHGQMLRVATPSGVVSVDADVVLNSDAPQVRSAALYRTARMLMRGSVLIPQ